MIITNTAIFLSSDHRLEREDGSIETLKISIDPSPPEPGSGYDLDPGAESIISL